MRKRQHWGYPGPAPTNPNPTGNSGGSYGPLIAAGLSTAGDITTQVLSNRARKQLEQQARDWNLEQWHRINAYNHPLAQIERLKAAGLNPNLIYGSSPGSAVGNAGAIHPGKAPEYKLTDPIGPGANLFMDTRVKQAQTNNIKGDTLLKATQSMKTAKEAGIKGQELNIINETAGAIIESKQVELEIKKIDLALKEGLKPYQIASAMSNAEKNALAVKLLDKDLEMAQSGFVKGNYIGTIMKGVYGLDMRNQTDRLKAQVIVTAILGSQVVNNLSSTFRTMLDGILEKLKSK